MSENLKKKLSAPVCNNMTIAVAWLVVMLIMLGGVFYAGYKAASCHNARIEVVTLPPNDPVWKNQNKGLDAFTLLNHVETFYNDAWERAIWLLGAIIAIFGVIVPLFLQARYLEDTKADITEKINDIQNGLKDSEEQKIEIENKVRAAKDDLETKVAKQEELLKQYTDDQKNQINEYLVRTEKTINEKTDNLYLTTGTAYIGLLLAQDDLGNKLTSLNNAIDAFLSGKHYDRIQNCAQIFMDYKNELASAQKPCIYPLQWQELREGIEQLKERKDSRFDLIIKLLEEIESMRERLEIKDTPKE